MTGTLNGIGYTKNGYTKHGYTKNGYTRVGVVGYLMYPSAKRSYPNSEQRVPESDHTRDPADPIEPSRVSRSRGFA